MAFNGAIMSEANNHLESIHKNLSLQTECLEKLLGKFQLEVETEEFRPIRNSGTADATGQIQLPLENRLGFDVELISYSAVAGAASNGAILFFMNGTVEPQNLYWSNPQTQYGSDKFHTGMILPFNSSLICQFLAVGNAQQVFVNLFTKRATKSRNYPYQAKNPGW